MCCLVQCTCTYFFNWILVVVYLYTTWSIYVYMEWSCVSIHDISQICMDLCHNDPLTQFQCIFRDAGITIVTSQWKGSDVTKIVMITVIHGNCPWVLKCIVHTLGPILIFSGADWDPFGPQGKNTSWAPITKLPAFFIIYRKLSG